MAPDATVFERAKKWELDLGMKTVGNDRKKPQLFSVSHFFSETISITVLTETNTVPIIRELRKRNYPIENSSISVENR